MLKTLLGTYTLPIIVFFRPTMHVYCFFKIMPRLSIVSGIIILYCSIPSNLYGGCSELFRSVRKSLGVFATLHGVPAAVCPFFAVGVAIWW